LPEFKKTTFKVFRMAGMNLEWPNNNLLNFQPGYFKGYKKMRPAVPLTYDVIKVGFQGK
jgi:hypothetical protein